MKDQIIITMGREHGSGGHYIADMIARELGIKLYDKDSIESEIVSEGYSEELIRRMDEKPVNFFASRRIGRFSNSLEVNVAEKTFDMIRAKAASGESFLLIGRCGEQVLKDDPRQPFHRRRSARQALPRDGEKGALRRGGHRGDPHGRPPAQGLPQLLLRDEVGRRPRL